MLLTGRIMCRRRDQVLNWDALRNVDKDNEIFMYKEYTEQFNKRMKKLKPIALKVPGSRENSTPTPIRLKLAADAINQSAVNRHNDYR